MAAGICYECGEQVAVTDNNTNYEPIVQMVKGKPEVLARHRDCSRGDVIVTKVWPKAQVQIKEVHDDEYDYDLDDLDDYPAPKVYLPGPKTEPVPGKSFVAEAKEELIKAAQQELDKLIKDAEAKAQPFIQGKKIPMPKHTPKPDDDSITLSKDEREALATVLYKAGVVEIDGQKIAEPNRFDCIEKKVLYKLLKGL